ncbi:MAG: coiled coil domain-containing protein [Gammaproteobacteria bacterium]
MLNQAYREKLEAQLQEWDAQLDLMKARASKLKADTKIEFESQLTALQQKRREAIARLEDLSQRGEGAWEDLKAGTEGAWRELADAMDSIAARFKTNA